MVIFLTSLLKTHRYADDGARIPVPLVDENGVLSNIRKYLKRADRLVVVANDPLDFADNDEKLSVMRESFESAGLTFKQYVALDARNRADARKIISHADLVILSGGKCLRQNKFFADIKLKDILRGFDGVAIGVSAGAMNLCETVANFPEELADIDEPRTFRGLGFAPYVVIPHFDGETDSYQFPCPDFDIAKDYIMPASFERELTGIPNGSYILVDECGSARFFGDVYSIHGGKSRKI